MVKMQNRTAVWVVISAILWVAIATVAGGWMGLVALGLMLTSFWTGTTYMRWYAGWKAARGEAL